MRIAFLGTPDFAVTCLAELVASGHEIVCVYSQPPAPRGRGQELKPSPVHAFAEGLGLPVRTPVSMKTRGDRGLPGELDLDAAVVVAFGQILVKACSTRRRHGLLQPARLAAAQLARRGPDPAGDHGRRSGHRRPGHADERGPGRGPDPDVRAGASSPPTTPSPPCTTSWPRSARACCRDPGRHRARDGARETPQPDEGVTYAKKIKSAEARIDWTRSAAEVDRHIRGLSPFPGAWFEAPSDKGAVRVKALLSRVEDGEGPPGQALDDALLIACGEGAVRLLRAQREGKGVQDAETFLRGTKVPAGAAAD
jgi:methionyl-tRNA formyltransferase